MALLGISEYAPGAVVDQVLATPETGKRLRLDAVLITVWDASDAARVQLKGSTTGAITPRLAMAPSGTIGLDGLDLHLAQGESLVVAYDGDGTLGVAVYGKEVTV